MFGWWHLVSSNTSEPCIQETRKEILLTGVFPEVYTAKLATTPAFISPQIDTSTLPVNLSASYSDLHSSLVEVKFLNQF